MNGILGIIKDSSLTQREKVNALAAAAENSLNVLNLNDQEHNYLEKGIICDLAEGNAPYKPRYNLVDFELFMEKGSDFLKLNPPENLLEAVNNLLILYKHIPSVTSFPVYLGNIDKLLNPFIKDKEDAYQIIKMFLTHIDRTLTDAFVHANIGPEPTTAGRLILRVERELENAVPNLTLKYDADITGDNFALEAVQTGLEVSKPYFTNHKMNCEDLGEKYGIASCYNGLPIGGGSFTLVRLNLRSLSEKSENIDQLLGSIIPEAVEVMEGIMDKRIRFLVEETPFFKSNFLVKEGLLDLDRYTAMFGVFGLAEAVNIILGKAGFNKKYGKDELANKTGLKIVKQIKEEVKKHSNKYCTVTNNHFLLHAQSGISSDLDTTPGCRIPTGDEPEINEHLLQAGCFHPYFPSGISDIFPFEKTYKSNPEAVLDIIKGAVKSGIRMFTFYSADSDLVRITGYLVKRSEMEKLAKGEQVLHDTTALGLESDWNGNLDGRRIR